MTDVGITDLFCGVGGSSEGAEQVDGVRLVMAANHWPLAIKSHQANHPHAQHDVADLSQVEPRRYPRTELAWFSPECTNHSIAKGKKSYDPAAERSRATMWDVLRFAEHHRYDGIIVENVVDVAKWAMWDAWRAGLRALGYRLTVVYLNSMFAGALGDAAPQDRNRAYVLAVREGVRTPDVAKWTSPAAYCSSCDRHVRAVQTWKRRDGEPWGKYRSQYVYTCPDCAEKVEPARRPASSVIDWTDVGTPIGERSRPLAEKTMWRIADGIRTYAKSWADAAAGLLVPVEGRDGKRAVSAHLPIRTMTTRRETGLMIPPPSFIAELRGGGSKHHPTSVPLATVTASGNHHMLISYYGKRGLSSVDQPTPTVTTRDRCALVGTPEHSTDSRSFRELVNACTFRMLSPAEVARAMALPDGYVIYGNKREQVKQIGNGVTPPAARDLVAAMREAVTGEMSVRRMTERRMAA